MNLEHLKRHPQGPAHDSVHPGFFGWTPSGKLHLLRHRTPKNHPLDARELHQGAMLKDVHLLSSPHGDGAVAARRPSEVISDGVKATIGLGPSRHGLKEWESQTSLQ